MRFYDFEAQDKMGIAIKMEEYEGKVILVVNTATECGFTPQYDDLQDLYEKYEEAGLEILDFPCNQFGNQASGTNEEIASFCDSRYGITFPHFAKIDVNGDKALPLFKFLQGDGNRHCLFLQTPAFNCFSQAGCLKFAVGPPTSWIYPLKSGS